MTNNSDSPSTPLRATVHFTLDESPSDAAEWDALLALRATGRQEPVRTVAELREVLAQLPDAAAIIAAFDGGLGSGELFVRRVEDKLVVLVEESNAGDWEFANACSR